MEILGGKFMQRSDPSTHPRRAGRWLAGWLACALLASFLSGCGGGSSGGGGTGVTVTVTPKTATVIVNGTQQFFASVSGGTVATIASSNGAVRAANVVTITTTSPHGLSTGQTVTISGVTDSSFNGTFTIATVPSTTTFTYAQTGPDASSGGGSVTTSAAKWFVNSVEGGNTTFGTISTTGLYTAPAVLPPATTLTIASNGAVRSNNVVTITTTAAHNLFVGQVVTISGVTDTSFNGTFTVASAPSSTTFTFSQTGSNATSGGGTVTSTAVQVKAVAVADNTKSDTATVTIDSGVRISVAPTTATVGTNEIFRFCATVTGSSNCSTNVNWLVNDVAGGNSTVGTISPNGLYTAPNDIPSPATVTVKATAVADPDRNATATVTVVTAADPTLTAINPTSAAQGSVFQDVYLTGTNFISTTQVFFNGILVDPSTITAASGTLLRVRLPDSILATATPAAGVPVTVQRRGGTPTPPQNFRIVPVRPALVGASPDSGTQGSAAVDFSVNGGYFGAPGPPPAPAVSAEFDGGVRAITSVSSRQLTVILSAADLATPGLASFAVRNGAVTQPPAAPQQVAVANLAIQPAAASIPVSPLVTLPVGTAPVAVAVNTATGIAVVANRGTNSITLIDLTTSPPSIVADPRNPITVGSSPTGIAVDNVRNLVVVANKDSNSLSIVHLPLPPPPAPPVVDTITTNIRSAPFAVGVNPLTGLALVAYQSANVASIIDLTLSPPAVVGAVTVGTGGNPQVAIEPRLNWALVTPGGTGVLSIVDLNRRNSSDIAPNGASCSASTATITTTGPHGLITNQAVLITGVSDNRFNGYFTVASAPSATTFTYALSCSTPFSSGGGTALYALPLATAALGSGISGIGINTETEKALLIEPSGPTSQNVAFFNLLDQSVSNLTLPDPCAGCTVAAAVNPLTDIGVTVNSTTNQASVINPRLSMPAARLATINVGTTPRAVAIDPGRNPDPAGSSLAIVANEGSNDVTILLLGPIRRLHVTQVNIPTNPINRQFSPSNPTATLTSTTDLLLTVVGKGFVAGARVRLDRTLLPVPTITNRQLTVTVPAGTFLSGPRRYALDVVNPTGPPSNVAELTVIQAVDVRSSGCAQPAPRAVAIDAEHDLAVVTNPGCNNISLIDLTTGTVSNTLAVGTNPQGVAIISRLGKAVVTNRGSNNASIVDLVGGTVTSTVTVGTEPIGVAINQDTGTAVVANSGSNTISTFSADTGGNASSIAVDARPVAVAIDPGRNVAAVANSTQNNINLVDLGAASVTARIGGFQLPTAVVFDPVTGFFLLTSSLANNLVIVNPDTQQVTPARVGINPTSMAYNFQSSTLVTVNTASNTVSVMDFLDRRVRAILGLTGSQQFSVDIHPRTNLAVIADENNNRVLLVPLPR